MLGQLWRTLRNLFSRNRDRLNIADADVAIQDVPAGTTIDQLSRKDVPHA